MCEWDELLKMWRFSFGGLAGNPESLVSHDYLHAAATQLRLARVGSIVP